MAYDSAGNNFFLFTGHMSFQIFILVGHLTNWTGHNLLTDNTLKKITQDVLVRCSVVVSDHNVKLAGHFQNLVGQCPMTDCYFQHCMMMMMMMMMINSDDDDDNNNKKKNIIIIIIIIIIINIIITIIIGKL